MLRWRDYLDYPSVLDIVTMVFVREAGRSETEDVRTKSEGTRSQGS